MKFCWKSENYNKKKHKTKPKPKITLTLTTKSLDCKGHNAEEYILIELIVITLSCYPITKSEMTNDREGDASRLSLSDLPAANDNNVEGDSRNKSKKNDSLMDLYSKGDYKEDNERGKATSTVEEVGEDRRRPCRW